jgi:hypothetical protein
VFSAPKWEGMRSGPETRDLHGWTM